MVASHQSIFVRTSLLKNNLFELKYKIAADFNQLLQFYKQQRRFKQIHESISIVEAGGISDRNTIKSVIEQYQIIKSFYKPGLKKHLYFWNKLAFLYFLRIARRLIPTTVYYYVVKSFYKQNLIDYRNLML